MPLSQHNQTAPSPSLPTADLQHLRTRVTVLASDLATACAVRAGWLPLPPFDEERLRGDIEDLGWLCLQLAGCADIDTEASIPFLVLPQGGSHGSCR